MRGKVQCAGCRESRFFVTNFQSGDVTCTKCGLVATERSLSDNASFTEADGRYVRPSGFGSALATRIGGADDASEACSSLRRTHDTIQITSRERRQMKVASEISRVAGALGVARHVRDSAVTYYQRSEASKGGGLRSKNVRLIAAAVLGFTCRVKDVPRTTRELKEIVGDNCQEIQVQRMTLKLKASLPTVRWPALRASQFVPRFCTALRVPLAVERVAVAIADAAQREGGPCDGWTRPWNIATGAIAIAVSDAARRGHRRGTARSEGGEVCDETTKLQPLPLSVIVDRTRVVLSGLKKAIIALEPDQVPAVHAAIEAARAPVVQEEVLPRFAATGAGAAVRAERPRRRGRRGGNAPAPKRARRAVSAESRMMKEMFASYDAVSRPSSPSPTSIMQELLIPAVACVEAVPAVARVDVQQVSLSAAEIAAALLE